MNKNSCKIAGNRKERHAVKELKVLANCDLPTYVEAPRTPPTPVATINEHNEISSNSAAACSKRLISPMPVPTETKERPAKRPTKCGVNTRRNCPTITKVKDRNTRGACDTCLKHREKIFRMREGAVSAIIINPVGLLVPAKMSWLAHTKVIKGEVNERPSIKKTTEHLGLVSRSFK